MTPILARILLLAAAGVAFSASPEQELKAALVLGIARFGEWPPSLPASAPIRMGVVGRADFVPVLERMVAGRQGAGGRRLEVKPVKSQKEGEDCQILYFADVPAKDAKAFLDAARDAPVITVGDSERFLEAGGAIHLYFEEDGRIAFEIRLDNFGRGVTISAKLLKLGHLVGPRGNVP